MTGSALRPAVSDRTAAGWALLLGLVYLILAIILTWPTFSHPASHLPGDGGDDPALAWNLWWIKYALLNAGRDPFQTDYMFYPVGINLAFYTLTLLNGLLALPLTLNLGVALASNLHLLFTFVAGGYGVFLLTRYLLARWFLSDQKDRAAVEFAPAGLIWLSAAIAGGFYAFASSKLFYVALGQFNIASSHWIPFAVLYVLRCRHYPGRLKNAVLAGLFLSLQAWSEMTYASFLLVFISLYWLYELLAAGRRAIPGRPQAAPLALHLRAAAVVGRVFLLGLSPILAHMLPDLHVEGDFLVEGSGFAREFSADLLGFIVPAANHPLLGDLVQSTGITHFSLGQHIYLGLALPGLLLVSLWTGYRRPQLWFWLLAVVVFALLSLGPVFTINGQTTGIPGPFGLIQQLPFFKGNRYPSRYGVMLILSLSVVAGFGLVQLGRLGRQWFGGAGLPLLLVSGLFLFEHLSVPLPQSDVRLPAAYEFIAADPGDFTVLDIPFAWRNGFRVTGALTTRFMLGQFYQTAHQKRLLQGNTSRNPDFKFQYFTTAPVISSLLALETGKSLSPERLAADRAIAAEVLRFLGIRYIIIRPYSYPWFNGAETLTVTHRPVIPYVEEVLPVEKVYQDEATRLYRVRQSEVEAAGRVDTAGPLAPLYFGQGWGQLSPGRPIAAQRREVELLLPLSGGPQRLVLRLRQPQELAQAEPQSVAVGLNGWSSPAQAVGPDWQEITFDLPTVRPGLNKLYLRFSQVSELPVLSTAGPVDVTVQSAGEETGDFGRIFINGHQVAPDQRGYNVVVAAADGSPLQVAAFDTHLEAEAAAALADFIASAPAGAILAVAAADEASASLNEQAVAALQNVGAAVDLRGCFRCSHAFIRDGNGEVYEAVDRLGPVGLTTRWGLTEPKVAALLESLRLEEIKR